MFSVVAVLGLKAALLTVITFAPQLVSRAPLGHGQPRRLSDCNVYAAPGDLVTVQSQLGT